LSYTVLVTGKELLRRLRRLAKEQGIAGPCWNRERGKGGHGTLYFGSKFAVIPTLQKELKTGTLKGILKQLDLRLEDLQ
jgi:predicted RNA binding protein YcfA (HicA-like mRNA interferase family)